MPRGRPSRVRLLTLKQAMEAEWERPARSPLRKTRWWAKNGKHFRRGYLLPMSQEERDRADEGDEPKGLMPDLRVIHPVPR